MGQFLWDSSAYPTQNEIAEEKTVNGERKRLAECKGGVEGKIGIKRKSNRENERERANKRAKGRWRGRWRERERGGERNRIILRSIKERKECEGRRRKMSMTPNLLL